MPRNSGGIARGSKRGWELRIVQASSGPLQAENTTLHAEVAQLRAEADEVDGLLAYTITD